MTQPTKPSNIRDRLRLLYHGHSAGAVRFRIAVLAVDLAIIAFFIAAPVLRETSSFLWLDYTVAVILAAIVLDGVG